ncbi:MAG: ABC transporter permease subunit [Actinobacteria bacterium]|nr:ABC transporter permease subunit [Actinomycetota bacterium]MSW41112.1 ABC transporter permease subunit [Actinomycetota bacterium]
MGQYAARKAGGVLVTLLGASLLIYGALYLAPGDPATLLAGGQIPNPEALEQIRAEHHLGDPFLVQYWHWLGGVLTGNFGNSIVLNEPVVSLLGSRVVNSVLLVVMASAIILSIGIALGVASAVFGKLVDFAALSTTTVLMAAPAFVSAIVLIWIFSSKLSWFPVYGTGEGFWDTLRHLVLPAIALSLSYLAFISRITRTDVRSELTRDHVDAARARGVSTPKVLSRHVMRNVMPAILSVSAITFAGLFAGTAVVELAFGVPGLGSLLVQSAARQDVVVVQSVSLLLVAAFVLVNMGVDIINAMLDPRLLRGRVMT